MLWKPARGVTVFLALLYGFGVAAAILGGAHKTETLRFGPPPIWIAFIGFLLSCSIALAAFGGFPHSVDEYGYVYLSETLLRGRLWNAPLPDGIADVFTTYYIPTRDGKRFSQYAPGWPALLAAFSTLGIPALANAFVGLGAGLTFGSLLRRWEVPKAPASALACIFLLSPFVIFNNASFFNHSLTMLAMLLIARLSWPRASSGVVQELLIGACFSILLCTRYEAFLLVCALFVVDALFTERIAALRRFLWQGAGALPLTLALLAYNYAITGNPFVTTLAWGSPEIGFGLYATGIDGVNTPLHALVRSGRFVTWWAEFASFAVMPAYILAIRSRVRIWDIRWFDLLLPASIVFFIFYPDGGGYQYGPRYWYLGWGGVALSLAYSLSEAGGRHPRLSQFSRALSPGSALLHCASFLGFILGYAMYAHIHHAARQVPLKVAATAPAGALVLIPDFNLRLVTWQARDQPIDARDYTRNGPDGPGEVALGRYLGPARTAQLCVQLPDRLVLRTIVEEAPPRARLVPACER